MGFLDKLKTQATDVAGTLVEKTQETTRTAQIQVQLRSLRSEEKDLLAEFGREAYRLHQEGTLGGASPELTTTAAKIADVRTRLEEKQAEAAETRGEGRPADENTVEGEAEEIVDASAAGGTGTTGTGTTGSASTGTGGTTAFEPGSDETTIP